MIRLEWVQHVIEHPLREVIQADGRIRRWARIEDMEGRYLRVVLLPDGETVHNAFFDRFVRAMKVKYFEDTDTLYIEFRAGGIVATKDLDENTQLDVDAEGNICALTIEHARERADLQHFSFEQGGT
jgi:uncharacterized protein YuzE